jgi:hypothetical protein
MGNKKNPYLIPDTEIIAQPDVAMLGLRRCTISVEG